MHTHTYSVYHTVIVTLVLVSVHFLCVHVCVCCVCVCVCVLCVCVCVLLTYCACADVNITTIPFLSLLLSFLSSPHLLSPIPAIHVNKTPASFVTLSHEGPGLGQNV